MPREAEQRRREADLSAEMARLLLGGTSIDESLPTLGQRVARAYGLPSVSVEVGWATATSAAGRCRWWSRATESGTVLVPRDFDPTAVAGLEERVLPALETLVSAARHREELEAQVIETKALRRSNVVQPAVLRSVSHDLRSPLTAITTAAGGLESETLSEEARAELASVVATESARLTHLVENLLDLSRLQAGSAEPRRDWCSVEEVVRAAVDIVPAPPAGFDIALDSDLPMLNADAVQLERAIANVLENSARYAGGEPVAIRGRAVGRSLTLRVIDRGPGIPKAELEQVFEPFHRAAERSGGGSGLGLAIARGFVEANGGRLRADSLPGQGAAFVFQLPVPETAPTGARQAESSGP